MTRSTIELVPAVEDALALARSADGALGAAMTGSGSAVFGIFCEPEGAERCASAAREAGYWATSTALSPLGCTVERL